ncbi:hypothetical protein SUDANB130_06718 [Streptomyces sp. enrichment culture]
MSGAGEDGRGLHPHGQHVASAQGDKLLMQSGIQGPVRQMTVQDGQEPG